MKSICLIVSLLMVLGIPGCGLILGTAVVGTAAVVGVVGAAGYTVYKGGSAVVSGVGSVGSSAKSLVVSDGVLKAKCEQSVPVLFSAAQYVLNQSGFMIVGATHDSLAGAIHASTALNERVLVSFKLVEQNLTSVEIKVGEGNLKQSEFLYDQMLAKIEADNGGGA